MPNKALPMSSMRLTLGNSMTKSIRTILYFRKLSWGAKCLAISMFDTPVTSNPSNKKLGRKLHVSTPQISRWKRKLSLAGIYIRFPEGEALPTPSSL